MKTSRFCIAALTILFLAFIEVFTATEQVFSDDFETEKGWTVDPYGTDDAITGMWERANPEGTYYQMDVTPGTGYNDLVTGALAGSSYGSYDIDDGKTSIRSPYITMPYYGFITLTFKYYLAHANNSSSADYLRVKIVDASGDPHLVFEELGASNTDYPSWEVANVDISEFTGQIIYLLIEAADESEPSLVEAGIDDVLIEKVPTPGEEDSLVVTGKIMLHPYNNDTARAVQLYGNYQTEPEDHISFEIVVPPTLNPTPQRYTFDDLAFRTTAMIHTSGMIDCDNIQCNSIVSSGDVQCMTITAEHSIRCDSIKTGELWVTENIYPDFVFKDKNYKLKSLSEIEEYIQKEKHLEGIPTEEEAREGFSVGKMQTKLLEKIEEMTLLMIQMDKRIKELEEQLKNK